MAVIEFENVHKAYRLGSGRGSVRDAIPEMFGRLVGSRGQNDAQLLWALKGVTFQVEKGEALGLVGHNGAGKTTILKLLSRVSKPTRGRMSVNGRLSALIELGAGFHPDLTGRENVYLNGSILGLNRREINRKFDSIVEFSGLHRFIDTPVKRYSSGMYVRLGFAVAIHVDPEVLLLDEVLSVGDRLFQRKCQEKMRQILGETTVIFVSHNLAAVNAVCHRAIWLDEGSIRCEGPVSDVTKSYSDASISSEVPSSKSTGLGRRWGNGEALITGVKLLNPTGDEVDVVKSEGKLGIEISYEASRRIASPYFGLGIHDSSGLKLYGEHTGYGPYSVSEIEATGRVCCWIESLTLPEGDYYLTVTIEPALAGNQDPFDYHDKMYMLRVKQSADVRKVGLLSLSTSWTHESNSI
jgi:lipopolysaccharide transport system ATP-binding protein